MSKCIDAHMSKSTSKWNFIFRFYCVINFKLCILMTINGSIIKDHIISNGNIAKPSNASNKVLTLTVNMKLKTPSTNKDTFQCNCPLLLLCNDVGLPCLVLWIQWQEDFWYLLLFRFYYKAVIIVYIKASTARLQVRP